MKKLIFVFLLACALALCLSACTENSAHTEVIDEAVAPTCTETGLTEGKHCSACGEVLVAQETIPAEGHDDQNNDGICDICTTKFASIGLAYTLSDDGTYYSVSGIGNCKDTDIVIPLMHNELPVKEIAYRAFYNCGSLTSVVIGDSVTSIGDFAFYHCGSLTSMVIGDSVTSIGEYAFYGCDSLTSVAIGDSVTSIGESAFSSCDSLTSVVIPDSVISIGKRAFSSCRSLTSVVIGDSVTSIGEESFYGCYKLVEVINHSILNIQTGTSNYGYIGYYAKEVHKGESKIVNQNGYLFYTYQGVNYLLGYVGNETDLILPEYDNGETYEINQYAFSSCASLTSVVIPNSVTSIGDHAFSSCDSLTSVVIPDSVTSIGELAFSFCGSLTSVVTPDSVTSIGELAFYWCRSLTSVVIGDSVTSIGERAFDGCRKLVEVINHSTLDIQAGTSGYGDIGYYAKEVHQGESKIVNQNGYLFYTHQGANYLLGYTGNETDLILPENDNGEPYEIDQYAFDSCYSLTSVVIGDSVTSIGEGAFAYCTGLTNVVIGDSVTSIGYEAFDGCDNLTNVVIGDSVTSIGEHAFRSCYRLTSVVIPDSVTSIGKYAFAGCTGLENIYYRGTASQWEAISKGYYWNSNTGSCRMTYNYTGE